VGIVSIILGALALLFVFGGLFTSFIPFVGTVMAFGAPVLAIAGLVLGGLGMSRAKRQGAPAGLPLSGVIVSGIALLPALVVALTCGLCNACFSAASLAPRSDGGPAWQPADDWADPTMGGGGTAGVGGARASSEVITWTPVHVGPAGSTYTMGRDDVREVDLELGGDPMRIPFSGHHFDLEGGTQYTIEVSSDEITVGDLTVLSGDPSGRSPTEAVGNMREPFAIPAELPGGRYFLSFRPERSGRYAILVSSGDADLAGGVSGNLFGEYHVRVTEGVPEEIRDQVEELERALGETLSGP